jgi:hypothetical protein
MRTHSAPPEEHPFNDNMHRERIIYKTHDSLMTASTSTESNVESHPSDNAIIGAQLHPLPSDIQNNGSNVYNNSPSTNPIQPNANNGQGGHTILGQQPQQQFTPSSALQQDISNQQQSAQLGNRFIQTNAMGNVVAGNMVGNPTLLYPRGAIQQQGGNMIMIQQMPNGQQIQYVAYPAQQMQ